MPPPRPLFSLGIFSDVQYADRVNLGKCHYRESLRHLADAIECFNRNDLLAVVNLGDLVDSNENSHLDAVLGVLGDCVHPFIHILGNHDLNGPLKRREVESRLGITNIGGERLRQDGWRVIAVDSTEISVACEDQVGIQAKQELAQLRRRGDHSAQCWNGRAGDAQIRQIEQQLVQANECGDRVLILNHMVANQQSGNLSHLCWNYSDLLEMLARNTSVAAHFNGHYHDGGFATDEENGIHYLTLPALCDSGGGLGAHAIAHFTRNSIAIEGWGRIASRVLPCRN
jgi:hypothetical protein